MSPRRKQPVTLAPTGHAAAPGRYAEVGKATVPGDLPREGAVGKLGKQTIVHGAVDDPNPALSGKRQRVAINAKTDALETEYAYGRISEAAYRAGRVYGRVLELAAGKPSGGGQWMEGDRVDVMTSQEAAIIRGLSTARRALEMKAEVLPIVGIMAANVLEMVLGERQTIAQVAVACDGTSQRMVVSFYAETFRRALQALADEWTI